MIHVQVLQELKWVRLAKSIGDFQKLLNIDKRNETPCKQKMYALTPAYTYNWTTEKDKEKEMRNGMI